MKKAYDVYKTINLINFVDRVQIQAHNDYWKEFYLQIKNLNLKDNTLLIITCPSYLFAQLFASIGLFYGRTFNKELSNIGKLSVVEMKETFSKNSKFIIPYKYQYDKNGNLEYTKYESDMMEISKDTISAPLNLKLFLIERCNLTSMKEGANVHLTVKGVHQSYSLSNLITKIINKTDYIENICYGISNMICMSTMMSVYKNITPFVKLTNNVPIKSKKLDILYSNEFPLEFNDSLIMIPCLDQKKHTSKVYDRINCTENRCAYTCVSCNKNLQMFDECDDEELNYELLTMNREVKINCTNEDVWNNIHLYMINYVNVERLNYFVIPCHIDHITDLFGVPYSEEYKMFFIHDKRVSIMTKDKTIYLKSLKIFNVSDRMRFFIIPINENSKISKCAEEAFSYIKDHVLRNHRSRLNYTLEDHDKHNVVFTSFMHITSIKCTLSIYRKWKDYYDRTYSAKLDRLCQKYI